MPSPRQDSSSPRSAGQEYENKSPNSPLPLNPPSNEDIEAVIKAATSTGTGPDGRPIPPKDTRTQLFVGNLPYRVRWQDLKDLFRKAGTVLRADVSLGPDNRSRGYGTVLLASAEDAGRAIDMFNGYNWQTRTLEVRPDRIPPADFDNPHGPIATNAALNMGLGGLALGGNGSPFGGMGGNSPQFANSPFASNSSPGVFGNPGAPTTSAVAVAAAALLAASGVKLDTETAEDFEFTARNLTPAAILQSVGATLERSRTSSIVGRNLFVGNLPFHCQWQDLKDLFRQAGTIVRADVALGPDGRSRGFGTVVFATDADADRAVNMFNGFSYNGRTLKVHRDRYSQPPSASGSPNPMAPTGNGNSHTPLYSSPLANAPLRMPIATWSTMHGEPSLMSEPRGSASPFDLSISPQQRPRTGNPGLEFSPSPPSAILGPMDIPATSTAFPAARAVAKLSPPDGSIPTMRSKMNTSVSGPLSSSISPPNTGALGRSPVQTRESPVGPSTSPNAQNSRHPGSIALPPPPPINAFPNPPAHTLSPQALPPHFSALHHTHQAPMMSPLHHPAHLAMMTPHGLPPITPSMPPFSFVGSTNISPLPSPHHAVFPMQAHPPPPQIMHNQHPLAQMHTPRRDSFLAHAQQHSGVPSPRQLDHFGFAPSHAQYHATSKPQHTQQQHPLAHGGAMPQGFPTGVMSPFTPGLVMSPGGFWDGRHPFINPAPGGPVLISPPAMYYPPAQQEDGYFPSLASQQQQLPQNPPESYFPLQLPPTKNKAPASGSGSSVVRHQAPGEVPQISPDRRTESDGGSRSRSRSDDGDDASSRGGAPLSSVATSIDVHGEGAEDRSIDVNTLSKRFEMLASRLVGEKERDASGRSVSMSTVGGQLSRDSAGRSVSMSNGSVRRLQQQHGLSSNTALGGASALLEEDGDELGQPSRAHSRVDGLAAGA